MSPIGDQVCTSVHPRNGERCKSPEGHPGKHRGRLGTEVWRTSCDKQCREGLHTDGCAERRAATKGVLVPTHLVPIIRQALHALLVESRQYASQNLAATPAHDPCCEVDRGRREAMRSMEQALAQRLDLNEQACALFPYDDQEKEG